MWLKRLMAALLSAALIFGPVLVAGTFEPAAAATADAKDKAKAKTKAKAKAKAKAKGSAAPQAPSAGKKAAKRG